jgi:hypothetical protein
VALARVWIESPNYSNRGNYAESSPRLLVVHSAEGSRTIESLGAYFSNPAAEASSHAGADDQFGRVGEYVTPAWAAWTQASYNGAALSIELCGFAAWDRAEWERHPTMLDNCRAWLAEESARHAIPLRLLSAGEAQGGGRGICSHESLGAWGGGHWDPGPGFPWDRVLGPAPPAVEDDEGANMVLHDLESGGIWVTDRTGAVFAYDGAPYLGGLNSPDHTPGGEPCVGIADDGRGGYVLVADFGDNPGDRFRRYHYPRR